MGNWEVFKYFHYFFMALVPAALLHASSGWYFMIGSVAFWLIDAAMRFVSSASSTPVLSVRAHKAEGGVTEIRFEKSFKEPGQYCFVNVPEISISEWHPFSLCSSPLDGSAQMCIKNMGPGTFTGKLHGLVKQCYDRGFPFALNVDGPYGPHLDPRNYAAMLLLAGGIGITPMHSTFRMLSQLASQGELPETLKCVRLVWVARSVDLFSILMDSLKECVQPGRIEAELYVDNPAQDQVPAIAMPDVPGLRVTSGRPSFGDLYDKISSDANQLRVLVKACGPGPMDAAAELAARSRRTLTYESELFVL